MNIELLSLSEAIESFEILAALALMVFYFVVEMLDSSLTFSLVQHKSLKTAVTTFILYMSIAIEVGAVVSNYLYVFPLAFGAALGAYVTVQIEKKKRPIK